MSAKLVQVRKVGDTTWLTLPGNTADLNIEKATVDDSVFGTVYTSNMPTLKSWTTSGNALLKGIPGYKASIKRAGTPTTVTGGSLTQGVDGTYYTDTRSQSLWANQNVSVYDDGEAVSSENIEYVDYLQGGVKFVDGYTPTGAITADFSYRATTPVCYFTSFDIGQTLGTEDITDFCAANENGGWSIFAPQQLEVDLSLDGFYNDNSDFFNDIVNDDEVVIEIDLTGEGTTVARGYFRASSLSESGDVGSTETSAVSYVLAVPEGVSRPFSYYIADDSVLPAAVRVCLEAWEDRTPVEFLYKPDGTETTSVGEAYVTDTSLSNSVTDMNTFSISFQGTDTLTRS